MEDRQQAHRARTEDARLDTAADRAERHHLAAQQPRRVAPERHDDGRLDQLDLAPQPRLAALDLLRMRIAVLRRPALQDVGDEDVVALKADPLEQRRQQLAGGSDERDSLLVLLLAGGLADEEDAGVGVSGSEDDLRPGLRKLRAALADARLEEELLQLLAALGWRARSWHCGRCYAPQMVVARGHDVRALCERGHQSRLSRCYLS